MDITLVVVASLIAGLVVLLLPARARAHCDTEDGPAVRDGRAALATGNVNHALKWVPATAEAEVRDAFALSLRVRDLGPDARELADRYFLETLVRVHRAGEGEAFTGLKPSGTVLDPRVAAADAAMETGDLTPLAALVAAEDIPELSRLLARARALRDFDVDDLAAGRTYLAAYVDFVTTAEGEHDGHDAHGDLRGHHDAAQRPTAHAGAHHGHHH